MRPYLFLVLMLSCALGLVSVNAAPPGSSNIISTSNIEWEPDTTGGKLILIIKTGVFSDNLRIYLTWAWSKESKEMAWCTFQNGYWAKVYPYGEDSNLAAYDPAWFKKKKTI